MSVAIGRAQSAAPETGNEALMSSSSTNRQVCVVDDDAAIRDALKTILEAGGYSIRMNSPQPERVD